MITPLTYRVPISTIMSAVKTVDFSQFRYALNEPTGDFFYDPWKLKEEYVGTVWEQILNTLPVAYGEARIVVLKAGTCYNGHADIDDRYHLNIDGQYSFLVNLDSRELFPQTRDGIWYDMDAGPRHSAVNFGIEDRVQIVIRKLLNNSTLDNFSKVEIKPIAEKPRYVFDDIISPWLNALNKQGGMNSFKVLPDGVQFNMDNKYMDDLMCFSKDKFKITVS